MVLTAQALVVPAPGRHVVSDAYEYIHTYIHTRAVCTRVLYALKVTKDFSRQHHSSNALTQTYYVGRSMYTS